MNILSFFKRHRSTLLLAGILVLATILRFYRLDMLPNGLNQDEAVNGYDAYSLAYTLRDHHGEFLPVLLQSFGDWVSPTLTYLTIPFVRILGLSLFTTRLPVALFGVFTVFLTFIFTFQLTKRKDLALLSAFIFSIIPWHITLSRWAIPPSIVPFFLILSVVLFYWAKQDTSLRGYYKITLFLITATLLTYAYPTEKLFAPVFVFSLCVIFLLKDIKKAIYTFCLYLTLISPQYILAYIYPIKYNTRFNYVSIFGHYQSYRDIIYQFLIRYQAYIFPDFSFGQGDGDSMHHVPGSPSAYSFLAVFFYLGIAFSIFVVFKFLLQRKTTKFSLLSWQDHLCLLAWFFISPIAASVTFDQDHLLRMVHFLPLIVIYSIVGLSFIVTFSREYLLAKKYFMQIITPAIYILVVILSIFNLWQFGFAYYVQYADSSKGPFQYGTNIAIDYAIAHQSQYSKIYVDNSINQPYIYYLFSSRYNPAQINYQELNANYVPGAYFSPDHIGKYYFVSLSQLPAGATLVHTVADQNRVWFAIYIYQDNLYIKKMT